MTVASPGNIRFFKRGIFSHRLIITGRPGLFNFAFGLTQGLALLGPDLILGGFLGRSNTLKRFIYLNMLENNLFIYPNLKYL